MITCLYTDIIHLLITITSTQVKPELHISSTSVWGDVYSTAACLL